MDILLPALGHGPGVVLAHAWWGLNQTIRDYGAALTEEGFVVGLADLFEGEQADTIEGATMLSERDWTVPPGARLTRAITELAAHPNVDGSKVGAIGFSYSGYHLFGFSARGDLPLDRLVVYYATRRLQALRIPVLAHFAQDDAFESQNNMAEVAAVLTAAGPPNAAYTYKDTQHWFAESDRPGFDAAAAGLAFERTLKFLKSY